MGTDGRTNGPTNQPTDAVSYRGATSRLKILKTKTYFELTEQNTSEREKKEKREKFSALET